MNSRILLALGLTCLVGVHQAAAEERAGRGCRTAELSSKLFEARPWYPALLAAPDAPQSYVYFTKSKRMPFTSDPPEHSMLEGSVGFDAPVIVLDRGDENAPIGRGCWGAGAWFSVVVPMVLDFTERGQPVLDTDYISAVAAKLAYGLSDRARLGFLFQYGHISAHTTWDAVDVNFGSEFEWVDVNHEFFRAGVSLESERESSVWTTRFSTYFSAGQGHQGFYSAGYRRADGSLLLPSERNWEPCIGLQYMSKGTSGWGPFTSYNVCGNSTYDYQKAEPGQKEKIRISQSLLIGLHNFSQDVLSIDPVVGLYVGRNPYGLFRNQNTWWSMRLGVLINR